MKTRIQELREEKNLSQTSLALQIGTTQTTLSKIEKGITTPDAGLIVLLAEYFHVSADYLLCLSNVRFTLESQCEQKGLLSKYIRYLTLYQSLTSQQRHAINMLLESICPPGHN